LADGVGQRQRHRRAIALDDVAHALVDGCLERVQALGRAELVVDRGDLELDAGRVAGTTEFFSKELVTLHLVHTHGPKQAGQGSNTDHLDGLALLGHAQHQRSTVPRQRHTTFDCESS